MKKIFHAFLIIALVGFSGISYALPEETSETYPVVILGSGVGALTSSIYLQRAGINTLVIEGNTPGGAIAQSPMVHNWPGEVEIEGQELVGKIRHHAEVNGATILSQEVTKVDLSERPFKITTRDTLNPEKTQTLKANSLIIATGATPKLLGIQGENKYWTKGVYSCAVCDGSLYKGKTVAVVGGGDTAVLEGDYLSNIAKKVYVVLRSDKFRANETLRRDELLKKPNVEVLYNTKISEIQGDGNRVSSVVLNSPKDSKEKLKLDAVFVAIGANPNSGMFKNQLDIDLNGYILLKDGHQTSIPGVYAVGDIVDPIVKQAVSAAGDGAKAALQAEGYLAIAKLPKTTKSLNIPNKAPLTHKSPVKEKPKVQATKVKNSDIVTEISSTDEYYKAIKNTRMAVVVDFYSPYCGPCRKLSPEFDKIAEKYQGRISFIKVNTSKFSEIAENYNVYGVPTVMVFQKGKETERKTGLGGITKLLQDLDKIAK